jgi:hypothetical protein
MPRAAEFGPVLDDLAVVPPVLVAIELCSDAGSPFAAAAELTGPRSVAIISGAYAAAPNSWSVVLRLQRLVSSCR